MCIMGTINSVTLAEDSRGEEKDPQGMPADNMKGTTLLSSPILD